MRLPVARFRSLTFADAASSIEKSLSCYSPKLNLAWGNKYDRALDSPRAGLWLLYRALTVRRSGWIISGRIAVNGNAALVVDDAYFRGAWSRDTGLI